jgi:hypothetical protein
MPYTVRYRNKMTQSGNFFTQYRTGMTDAGMPMPALVFRMPMPTYAYNTRVNIDVAWDD